MRIVSEVAAIQKITMVHNGASIGQSADGYINIQDTIEINLQDLYDKYKAYCDEVTASESMPWRSFEDYAKDYISLAGEGK
jgi:hypothetical protein